MINLMVLFEPRPKSLLGWEIITSFVFSIAFPFLFIFPYYFGFEESANDYFSQILIVLSSFIIYSRIVTLNLIKNTEHLNDQKKLKTLFYVFGLIPFINPIIIFVIVKFDRIVLKSRTDWRESFKFSRKGFFAGLLGASLWILLGFLSFLVFLYFAKELSKESILISAICSAVVYLFMLIVSFSSLSLLKRLEKNKKQKNVIYNLIALIPFVNIILVVNLLNVKGDEEIKFYTENNFN
ncbi:hypothetical protein SCHIN_v1c09700 [Spiroplasma chinense]|uniref:Uncharacterized protein n=1 Tax=Spiroplasma chinense TaxID=216932 RepID=A0A5B9Y5S9_9MOLU|nr:hypothetical protein [Spiroplasma chinense]QEH62163.1 hypothetical protein SCHIN_v1c09700 [Spiroplasma chinense]